MDLKAQFGEIIDKLRRQKPVIHHITNYVTAESCADIALAAGASPVMADEPEEVEEITCNADALVLNFGTFSFNKMISMEKAVIMAKEAGIPVILDPVGVMSSSMRLQFALKLLENRYISIVRGNFSSSILGKLQAFSLTSRLSNIIYAIAVNFTVEQCGAFAKIATHNANISVL